MRSTTALLSFRAMPEIAAALRRHQQRIVTRWEQSVAQALPDADDLTPEQLRNSLPKVLEQLAGALESAAPGPTTVLSQITREHGVTRFHQQYSVHELLAEYRMLRRIVVDEMKQALGERLTVTQVEALDAGVDITLQQGVAAFVEYQNEQLRAANEARAKHLSFLSHDLRNNLNGVLLLLGVLARSAGNTPEVVGDVAAAHRSIEETMAGMDRLLQAERMRQQGVRAKRNVFDLRRLATEVAAQFAREAQARGVGLAVSVPAGAVVDSDWELVRLILQNLVGNAVKFSGPGTVRLGATPTKGGAGAGKGGWAVSVADEGPGIEAAQLDRIFGAFARGETHGQKGVGLGLTIASDAARLLGTELKAESNPGAGSTFTLCCLPAAAGAGAGECSG